MYFWRIEQLKDEIKTGVFNEKDRLYYALIYIMLHTIFFELAYLLLVTVGQVDAWDYIDSLGYILSVLLGTLLAFKANGGALRHDFLGRYFSLGFIICFKFSIILILIFSSDCLLFWAFDIYFLPYDFLEGLSGSITWLILSIWIYYRLYKHMSDLRAHDLTSREEQPV